jgi:hypothetical protein
MKSKKGRVFTAVPNNVLYSNILFSISASNNYPQKVAESLNKNTANILRQLALLEKQKYVSSKLEGNKVVFPFEKRIYSINWPKIHSLFIERIASKIKEEKDLAITHEKAFYEEQLKQFSKSTTIDKHKSKIETNVNVFLKNQVKYKDNDFIRELLKETFSNFKNTSFSLNQVFDKLILIIPEIEYKIIYEIVGNFTPSSHSFKDENEDKEIERIVKEDSSIVKKIEKKVFDTKDLREFKEISTILSELVTFSVEGAGVSGLVKSYLDKLNKIEFKGELFK